MCSMQIYHYAGSVAEYMARSSKLAGGVSGMTKKDANMYHTLDAFAVHVSYKAVERAAYCYA